MLHHIISCDVNLYHMIPRPRWVSSCCCQHTWLWLFQHSHVCRSLPQPPQQLESPVTLQGFSVFQVCSWTAQTYGCGIGCKAQPQWCSSSSPQCHIALANLRHGSREETRHFEFCHQNRVVPSACKEDNMFYIYIYIHIYKHINLYIYTNN